MNSKGWQTVALLSIIIPMSLLTTFKLTGLIGETREAQTISESRTLNLVTWEQERPQSSIHILDTVGSFYTDDELSLNCSILTYYYNEPPNHYNSGFIDFKINITASFEEGFATDLNVTFTEDYPQSSVGLRGDLIEPSDFYGLTNMALVRYVSDLSGNLKAFAQFASVGEPEAINVWLNGIDWVFQSPENRSHSMEADVSLTYYNGSVYKRVLQPFLLEMVGHNNNDFETAIEIHEGVYSNLYLDELDYYKIYANVGENVRINIYAVPADPGDTWATYEINVYDPNLNSILHKEPAHSSTIEFTSNSTGYWYIELRMKMAGLYTMEVTA